MTGTMGLLAAGGPKTVALADGTVLGTGGPLLLKMVGGVWWLGFESDGWPVVVKTSAVVAVTAG